MKKHIIFDFGGVFLNLNGKHSGVPKQLSEIFQIEEEVAERLWKANRERLLIGKETPKQFLEYIVKEIKYNKNVDTLHEKWKKD